MAGFGAADVFVVASFAISQCVLANQSRYLACFFAEEGVGYGFSVLRAADHSRGEAFGDREESFLDEGLGLVKIGQSLSAILDVRSDKGCLFIDGLHFLLTIEIVLEWIGKSKVVVLQRGSKDYVALLHRKAVTFLENSAVSSISLVLDVTDWKQSCVTNSTSWCCCICAWSSSVRANLVSETVVWVCCSASALRRRQQRWWQPQSGRRSEMVMDLQAFWRARCRMMFWVMREVEPTISRLMGLLNIQPVGQQQHKPRLGDCRNEGYHALSTFQHCICLFQISPLNFPITQNCHLFPILSTRDTSVWMSLLCDSKHKLFCTA